MRPGGAVQRISNIDEVPEQLTALGANVTSLPVVFWHGMGKWAFLLEAFSCGPSLRTRSARLCI